MIKQETRSVKARTTTSRIHWETAGEVSPFSCTFRSRGTQDFTSWGLWPDDRADEKLKR